MLDTEKFILVGENLYLDFVNTKIRRNGETCDLLHSEEDFLAWSLAVGLIDKARAADLRKKITQKDFRDILDFRTTLDEMNIEILNGKKLQTRFIESINNYLKKNIGHREIKLSEGEIKKDFVTNFEEPLQLLAPIAESAADLLAEGDLSYLKRCESNECVLYFYDTTKNHSRRWCSMNNCGNRAKAKAFYKRKKSKSPK